MRWCPAALPAKMLGGAAMLVASVGLIGTGHASTRAEPFPGWGEPTIDADISVDQAKAIVAERTKAQTDWKGPTDGPRASTEPVTIAWVSGDESYSTYIGWGNGLRQAAKALGWKVLTFNGQGTVSGQLAAMQQALAANPSAIITPVDANALQKPIKTAIANNIPVIGIHATAFPGPSPQLGLYQNITSSPAEIGQSQAAYVIAMSDGHARVIHTVDNSYAIARFKARAATEPVKNCAGCKLLEIVNIPIGDLAARIPSTMSGLLARYGDGWWMTTCCDDYYPYIASSLHSAGIPPGKARLVGADAPPATYDLIRKGNYEVASVPEPSTLFGYEAVDAVVRAIAGEPPAKFIQPTFIITRDNVDTEGGKNHEFVPSNNFACHYMNIWKGTKNPC